MSNPKYIKLTDTVYKIIEFFPEGEPLKNKTKEKSLEIMEKLVLVFLPDNPHPNTQKGEIATQVLKDIEVLENYLSFGKLQSWIDNMNLMILLKEYDKIKEEIKPLAELIFEEKTEKIQRPLEKKTAEIPVDNNVDKPAEKVSIKTLSSRQEKILEILEGQKKAQVADFKKALPDVTKRTLRRDLDDLLKKQKVVRVGEWNQVFYKIYRSPRPDNIQVQSSENLDGTHQMS